MSTNTELVKLSIKNLLTKEGRRIILIGLLTPMIILFLVISLFIYILSIPSNLITSVDSIVVEDKAVIIDELLQYKNNLKFKNKVVDRGGLFAYPTDGEIGSRGFSDVPVMHPVLGKSRPHWGQDFITQWHSNVYSIADGKVVDLGIDDEAGIYLTIYHAYNGKSFYTRYLHLSCVYVCLDSEVKQGDVIAAEGGEPDKKDGQQYDQFPGTSTSHHLHFEVREGSSFNSAKAIDPKLYINPIPVEITCKNNNSKGSITVSISGGRERGYDVSKDGGKTWTTIKENTYTFRYLDMGTYNIAARDTSYKQNISRVIAIYIN